MTQVEGASVVVVAVVVVVALVTGRQSEGQKPYSPNMWVPAVVVEVLHQGASLPLEVQEV